MEELLLEQLCETFPSFNAYYTTKQYLLLEDDMTEEPSIKDIIINGADDTILYEFEQLGIYVHNNKDEILGNLLNIKRLATIYNYINPQSLTELVKQHPNMIDNLLNFYNDGLVNVEELLSELLSVINVALGKPEELNDAIAMLMLDVNNDGRFLNYLKLINEYIKLGTDIESEDFKFQPLDVINLIKHVLSYQDQLRKNVTSFIYNVGSKLYNDKTLEALDSIMNVRCELYLADILSKNNIIIQKLLIANNYVFEQLPTKIQQMYITSNHEFLKYYVVNGKLFTITELHEMLYLLFVYKFSKLTPLTKLTEDEWVEVVNYCNKLIEAIPVELDDKYQFLDNAIRYLIKQLIQIER